MKENENQGELFESEDFDSKEELLKWRIQTEKAKAEKMATDNALRNGTLVYASKAEDSFRKIINVIYGTLQVMLSETLPYEIINLKTTGEIRDRLVSCYNDVVRKGQETLEAELKKEHEKPKEDIEETNGEPEPNA